MQNLNRSFPMSSNGLKSLKDRDQKLEFQKRGSTLFKRQVGPRQSASSRSTSWRIKMAFIYLVTAIILIGGCLLAAWHLFEWVLFEIINKIK